MAVKVALISDLHADSFHHEDNYNVAMNIAKYLSLNNVDVLIDAGDILTSPGNHNFSNEIFEHLNDFVKCKIYIPGNHDYYGGRYLYRCNYEEQIVEDVVFISCTLWTHIPTEFAKDVQMGMSDSTYIKNYDINELNKLNAYYVESIESAIGKYKDKSIVIATHHAPSFKSVNKEFEGSRLNHAFANDLDELIKNSPNVKYWVHGHMHRFAHYKIGETNIICNPRGYRGENPLEYKPFIFEI